MLVSCVCVTGSTEINAHLRADLLWRMVNSMHSGARSGRHQFELILVDNCHGDGPHREAIDEIFETYATVTHMVRNRANQFHGGGVNQGMALTKSDLLIQVVDDLEWSTGWLDVLIEPLLAEPARKLIAAPLRGHNCTTRLLGRETHCGIDYDVRTNAAAYCWAFWRKAWNEIGPWRAAHYADTRWSRRAASLGYQWTVPRQVIARETNLNYLRPWNYIAERSIVATKRDKAALLKIWEEGALLTRTPYQPTRQWPLRNPQGVGNYGPGSYPDEWLRGQGVPGK